MPLCIIGGGNVAHNATEHLDGQEVCHCPHLSVPQNTRSNMSDRDL